LVDENQPYTFIVTQEIANDPLFKSKCLSLSKTFVIWDENIDTNFTTDLCIAIDDEEFKIDYTFDEFYLIDLREITDFEKDHIEHASSIPLEEINNAVVELDPQFMYYLYADHIDAVGFAAAVFKRNGIHNLRAVFPPFEILKNTLAS
jgi:rhodanese-related sulfurtransferase